MMGMITLMVMVLANLAMDWVQVDARKMTIAAVFDEGGDRRHELAFRHAVQAINRNRDILAGVELYAETVQVPPDDSFVAERETCHLLEKGVVAIFGPTSKFSSEHIRSITDSMEIPFIETRWNYRSQRKVIGSAGGYAFNLHPDITTLGTAYLDLLEAYQWKTITILYQDNDSMMTIQQILKKTATVGPMDQFRLVVKQLVKNQNGYRDVLKEIFISESNLIVLDCEKKILEEVLIQCQQVGLISQGYYFLLTSLDAHTINLDDFKYGGTNITAFRMINVDKPEVQNVIYSIVESMLDRELRIPTLNIPAGNLDTTTALIYDSVHAFALALNELSTVQQVHQRSLDCSGQNAWVHGNSLMNYMKMVEFVGLSGPIKFDTSGLRTNFEMDLMELQRGGLTKVGSWNSLDHLALARQEKKAAEGGTPDPMANKTFIITAILNPPYTMLVESHEKLSGNARFEGFAIDLASELAGVLGFNFTFKLVDDDKYGSQTSPGKWNGMLGEVMDGTADFCIADISITSARTSAFAFTMPWLNLGISILYVKPRAAPPSLVAFLEPFTTDVYIVTLLAFVLVTLLICVLARFSPNQWEEPDACVKDPEELSNQFNLSNSSWFVIGALMQQGSDIVPISLCVRFASGMWYFFALIMIASYTANLAAFLTVETLERPIESVEDLAAQQMIKYGAMKGGSTAGFFENSNNDIYKTLWDFMSGVHQSEVMLESNLDGVEKVENENGKYAFFMESASIQYLVERRCKLSQVGGLLDSKGYGIATRKGTPYKELLDNAILKLLEGGTLHRLKIRWWKQKRGGGACNAKGAGGGVKPLGLANVAGVFLVTMIGCAVAGVFAILEFLYGTKQAARDSNISWAQKMREEMDFFLQCVGNTREIGCDNTDSESSKSEKSHSSHLSLEESPSDISDTESPYRIKFGMVESPYSKKSGSSHKSSDSRSTKLGSGEEDSSKNGNPFCSD